LELRGDVRASENALWVNDAAFGLAMFLGTTRDLAAFVYSVLVCHVHHHGAWQPARHGTALCGTADMTH
jgi:hypothetical protein